MKKYTMGWGKRAQVDWGNNISCNESKDRISVIQRKFFWSVSKLETGSQ